MLVLIQMWEEGSREEEQGAGRKQSGAGVSEKPSPQKAGCCGSCLAWVQPTAPLGRSKRARGEPLWAPRAHAASFPTCWRLSCSLLSIEAWPHPLSPPRRRAAARRLSITLTFKKWEKKSSGEGPERRAEGKGLRQSVPEAKGAGQAEWVDGREGGKTFPLKGKRKGEDGKGLLNL